MATVYHMQYKFKKVSVPFYFTIHVQCCTRRLLAIKYRKCISHLVNTSEQNRCHASTYLATSKIACVRATQHVNNTIASRFFHMPIGKHLAQDLAAFKVCVYLQGPNW